MARSLPLLAAGLGVLLGLPTLAIGWGYADDVLQRYFMLTADFGQALTQLFRFLDPNTNLRLMDTGVYPWWTLEGARVFFFRPLSAFSLWLDYQLWPDSNVLMHLHSALWYGALCLIAALLYRRLAGNTASMGLAALLFSLSIAHIGCVISLAARNLLLAAAFGLLAVYFHDRWRRDGSAAGMFLALLCLVLALLSAETGVATAAYLFAYALFLDEHPWPKRLLSLLPYGLILAAWWGLYQYFGFGALGSGFYLNPVKEPLQFLLAVAERFPLLLFGQWVFPEPATYAVLSSGGKLLYWIVSLLVLTGLGFLLAPLIRRDKMARFLCCGMLVAVVPVCAVSPPSGRHLLFISFGAFGLMAQFIVGRLRRQDWIPARRFWLSAAMLLSVFFLGLHAFLYPVVGSFVRQTFDSYSHAITDLGPQPEAASHDIIVINAPSPGQFIYLPAIRSLNGQPMPAHLRILAPGYSSVSVTRIDENTLIIRPASGYLLSPDFFAVEKQLFFPFYYYSYAFQYGDKLFRGDSYPMRLGQEVDLTGLGIRIVGMTEDGRPQEASMRFDLPLDDPSYTWLQWDWATRQYLPFTPPGIGKTVYLPGPF